jgi:PKD repeat protein
MPNIALQLTPLNTIQNINVNFNFNKLVGIYLPPTLSDLDFVPFTPSALQDYYIDYFDNYKIVISGLSKLRITDKDTGKIGYFNENHQFVSAIPYTAGFMEYSKNITNGEVDTLYVVAYPRSYNVKIETETPPNDLDPVTVLTFKNTTVEQLTVISEKPIYLETYNNSTILIKSNESTWVNITLQTLNTTTTKIVGGSFNISIMKNSTVSINTTTPNEINIDLDGDGKIDKTLKAPIASFTVSKTTAMVYETITFNASLSYDPDGTIVSYEWDFGDNTTANGTTVSHAYTKAGTYIVTLTVTDNDGNKATQSIAITVLSLKPIASFTYTPTNPTTADTIQFTDQSYDPDGNITAWHWDFGDGTTSNAQNPTHRYTQAGTYTVTLTVTDNDGNTNSTSKTIVVRQASTTTPTVHYYGGGGGYIVTPKPTSTPTPTPTPTPTQTPIERPKQEETITETPTPTETATPTPTMTKITPVKTPEKKGGFLGLPGFEIISAIVAIAYAIARMRGQR